MPYKRTEIIHNLNAPNQIVPLLMEIFNPKSVVDIGCGLGTFLKVFKDYGVKEVLGIDGPWVNKKLLSKYLATNEFLEINLEKNFQIDKKYDLALCLEVAEHISSDNSDTLVKNLTTVSDIIIFSAAVPLQGGQNHLNEQWIDYWQAKFAPYNFTFRDGLRQLIWDNKFIESWYKQNTFIIAKSNVKTTVDFKCFSDINSIQTYIHPDIFTIKSAGYHNFYDGKLRSSVYLKLLIKSIFRKFHINL
jgi:SAM-dependent methyltransferase